MKGEHIVCLGTVPFDVWNPLCDPCTVPPGMGAVAGGVSLVHSAKGAEEKCFLGLQQSFSGTVRFGAWSRQFQVAHPPPPLARPAPPPGGVIR